MSLSLCKISYGDLNSRQKEHFNFQKISAVLADYGFVVTFRLSDDWQGADFIAHHIDGESFLKVQLKSRLGFAKKYVGKNIYISFFENNIWYLYPHDSLLDKVLEVTNIANTQSWNDLGEYSFPSIPGTLTSLLTPHSITGDLRPSENTD